MLSRPIPQPRGETRKRIKGRKKRTEAKVKRAVRAACVERDGYCRINSDDWMTWTLWNVCGSCAGPSEWAHLKGHRRSQTRGMSPGERHTTKHTLILCRHHHRLEESGQMKVRYLSRRGCDGPLRFTL